MTRTIIAAIVLSVSFPLATLAQMRGHDMGNSGGMQGMQGQSGMQMGQPGSALTDGEVRKIDKDAKKLTLRHAPIKNLDMPAMTMVFQVKDLAMLDQVKVGDKVKFQAEKIGGALTVTQIEAAK